MPEEKEKNKPRYEVTTVATETAPVIHDTEKDQTFDVFLALCEVLNGLDQLKKRIE